MKDIGWKRIVISSNAELCKKNSCVSVKTDDTLKMIPIGQIDILIIESEQVSVNAPEKGNIVALPLTINDLSKLSVIKGTENILSDLSEDVFFL